jgi:predicted HTH domain antitoxin
MTYKPLTESVELYRTEECSLTEAASRAGVTAEELVGELRSRGVPLRDGDQDAVTSTRY